MTPSRRHHQPTVALSRVPGGDGRLGRVLLRRPDQAAPAGGGAARADTDQRAGDPSRPAGGATAAGEKLGPTSRKRGELSATPNRPISKQRSVPIRSGPAAPDDLFAVRGDELMLRDAMRVGQPSRTHCSNSTAPAVLDVGISAKFHRFLAQAIMAVDVPAGRNPLPPALVFHSRQRANVGRRQNES